MTVGRNTLWNNGSVCRCALLALWALSACGDDDADGSDAAVVADGGLDAAEAETVEAATVSLAYAAALTAPLIPDAQMLRDNGGVLDGVAREMMTQMRVENGVSGNSVVTDASCVTFVWGGLSATVTFNNCILEETGEPLSGSISLAVSFHPSEFVLTLSDLTSGSRTLSGNLTLNVGGACSDQDKNCSACPDTDPSCEARRQNQSTLSGNLTVMEGGSTTVTIESLTLARNATGTTVSGTVASSSSSLTASNIRFEQGDCLPSSGTLTLDGNITVEFVSTTPSTGTVNITVPPFPTIPQMLFEAC